MRTPITLVDNETGDLVEAQLFDEVTTDHFLETENEWRPLVRSAALRVLQEERSGEQIPQHWHWDWTSKTPELGKLGVTFYGVECVGKLQGLMKLETVGYYSRIPDQRGAPLVFVDYLETAPWNIRPFMVALGLRARFSGVGTQLIEAAVRLSMREGYEGRIGLHSLPVAENFYLRACKMTSVERDPGKQNMLWCEFTPEQAQKFLRGDNR